jgi:hypothetical protein
VHESIAGIGLFIRRARKERSSVIGRLHQSFELTSRQIADDVSRLDNAGFEIGCARVDEDEAIDVLPLLERLQEHLFQRDGRPDEIVRMSVPCSQSIGSVGVEAMTGIEEDESIAGRQTANHVGEIVFKRRTRGIGIKPKADVLGGHSKVLDEDLLHRNRIRQGVLDWADVLLLIGLDSDQNGVCHSH